MSDAYDFRIRRSAELRQRTFIATSEAPKEEETIRIFADRLTPELRARLAELVGLPTFNAESILIATWSDLHVEDNYNHRSATIVGKSNLRPLDEELTAETLPAILDQIEPGLRAIAALQPQRAARQAELDRQAREAEREAEAKRKRDAEYAEREKARKEAAQEAKEAERRAWIDAHGSPFLRKAVAAGYDCQRRYVLERARLEHPGAVVDFEDAADWKSRSCPSERALDFALSVGGEVVWLTKEPQEKPTEAEEHAYDEPCEPCEAVVLRGYLGKYDLVWTSW